MSAGLLVAETFGPTFQGEGASAGQLATFIRLSRCNLRCPACDTPYTWDWSRFDPTTEARRMSAEELCEWVLGQSVELVVITGGEPLLQQNELIPLVERLTRTGLRVEIETNGTISPRPELLLDNVRFNVSPKLSSFAAAEDETKRINQAALTALAGSGKAVFKFVATRREDIEQIVRLRDAFGLNPAWVMPEGTTSQAVLSGMSQLAKSALEHGLHLSTRLHVLLWGDQRGR